MPRNRPPSHPGEILRELFMKPLGFNQTQLARHLGCTRAALNEIVNGKRGITPLMAYKLADAFKTTPELWMNLPMKFDLWRAGQKHRKIAALKAS
ncbi:MAG: HigA family addiction module antidote protein [Planctomycetes bacterium]|nr:HigA family addiction module antidote protein [Planctomycetota bacterium]